MGVDAVSYCACLGRETTDHARWRGGELLPHEQVTKANRAVIHCFGGAAEG